MHFNLACVMTHAHLRVYTRPKNTHSLSSNLPFFSSNPSFNSIQHNTITPPPLYPDRTQRQKDSCIPRKGQVVLRLRSSRHRSVSQHAPILQTVASCCVMQRHNRVMQVDLDCVIADNTNVSVFYCRLWSGYYTCIFRNLTVRGICTFIHCLGNTGRYVSRELGGCFVVEGEN